jgi:hypothetical protein
MAGVKGRSGTNKNKEKPFADALRMEISAAGDDHKRLRRIAAKLLDLAEAGDMQAINAVADRLDGKPAQESTVTIDDKRDATDWTRDELVAFLSNTAASGEGASEAEGRSGKSDRVH